MQAKLKEALRNADNETIFETVVESIVEGLESDDPKLVAHRHVIAATLASTLDNGGAELIEARNPALLERAIVAYAVAPKVDGLILPKPAKNERSFARRILRRLGLEIVE